MAVMEQPLMLVPIALSVVKLTAPVSPSFPLRTAESCTMRCARIDWMARGLWLR